MAESASNVRRLVNRRIADVSERFTTPGEYEFLCECDRPDCTEYVVMPLETYRTSEGAILAPGHYSASGG